MRGRDPQIPEHDRRKERDRTDDGDRHEDQLAGQNRVDVGEARAAESGFFPTAPQQFVPVEPIGHRLERDEQTRKDGQLDTRRVGDVATATAPARDADSAEDVVRDQTREERQDDRDEQPVEDETEERQVECVEPDVQPELRIGGSERPPVEEHLDCHPARLGNQTGQHTDADRDAESEGAHPGHDRRPIPRDRVAGPGCGHEHRTRSVGEEQCKPQHRRHENSDDEEQRHSRQEDLDVYAAEIDGAEPQPVGIGIQDSRAEKQQHGHHQGENQQSLAPLRQTRYSGRGPHAHVPRSQLVRRRGYPRRLYLVSQPGDRFALLYGKRRTVGAPPAPVNTSRSLGCQDRHVNDHLPVPSPDALSHTVHEIIDFVDAEAGTDLR